MNINNFKGVVPPIITPIDENENVYPKGLKEVVDYVLDGGVHGLFVMGSNGEFYGFDRKNKLIAAQTVVEHNNKRVPVYAGLAEISTAMNISLAKDYEDVGVDALTLLSPMFISPSEDEMYDHFACIAQSTKLPILLYNNPGKTTNNISVSLLKRLACVDNIVGIKNTNLDFSQTIKYIDATKDVDNFKVFGGIDYYVLSTLMHGGCGCIAGTANVAPKLVVEIYESFIHEEYAKARLAQEKLIPLRTAYGFGTFPVVMKQCLNIIGINTGNAIRPVQGCSEEKVTEIKQILKELKII